MTVKDVVPGGGAASEISKIVVPPTMKYSEQLCLEYGKGISKYLPDRRALICEAALESSQSLRPVDSVFLLQAVIMEMSDDRNMAVATVRFIFIASFPLCLRDVKLRLLLASRQD